MKSLKGAPKRVPIAGSLAAALLAAALLLGALPLAGAAPAAPGTAVDAQAWNPDFTYEFGLIGDLPYDEEQEEEFDNLIDEVNEEAADIEFVVHDGDIKGGSTECTDENLQENLDRFDRFETPLVYTPGDNEWTDCHRTGSDPLERLERVREVFFSDPYYSLGQRVLAVEPQVDEGYPENARWRFGRVTYATPARRRQQQQPADRAGRAGERGGVRGAQRRHAGVAAGDVRGGTPDEQRRGDADHAGQPGLRAAAGGAHRLQRPPRGAGGGGHGLR